jgi:hypothetical protein
MSEIKVDLVDAPTFLAGLVREGVVFKAAQEGDFVIVKLTGGF